MMDLWTLQDEIVAAIAADAALNTWCATTYGASGVAVEAMPDDFDLPASEDCPYVVVDIEDDDRDRELSGITATFALLCFLAGGEDRTLPGQDNVAQRTEQHNLGEFSRLVFDAVDATGVFSDSQVAIVRRSRSFATDMLYPLMGVEMLITLKRTMRIGDGDPLA